ncbi:ribonuclease III [Actinomadura scrupuli]|uniref:ribonuclease III n=1 Tax=Actinomadura scrupuli TaxID=559629 RepID=UPI003D97D300
MTDGSAPDWAELQESLGVTFSDTQLLELALTHRSYAYERGGQNNERLEFIGDSVLDFVIASTLFDRYPAVPEGVLAKLRAAVVNQRAVAEVARSCNVGAYIRLGTGEESSGGRDKKSILGDTMEALIGAVYLDRGDEEVFAMVLRLFGGLIDRAVARGVPALDWKASLGALASALGLGKPEYVCTGSGPEHNRTYRATVTVGGKPYGPGNGRSTLKAAETDIAEAVYTILQHQAAHSPGNGEAGQGPGGSH